MIKLISHEVFEQLFRDAKDSKRKRSHLLLHQSHQDKVQRLLIAMIQDSYVEPHYHELSHQWELFNLLEGKINLVIYNKNLEIIDNYILDAGTGPQILEILPNTIHSVKCLSHRALLLEVKEGPFQSDFAKKIINY